MSTKSDPAAVEAANLSQSPNGAADAAPTVLTPTPVRQASPLAAKIARVQSEMKLAKEGKAGLGQYSYSYVTEAQIFDALRERLSPLGVAVFVSYPEITREEDQQQTLRSGQVQINLVYRVKCEVEFIDADSGESKIITSHNVGIDSSDKAVNKAQTSALRTLLLKQFLAMGDVDPEQESPAAYGQRQPQQAQRQPAQQGNAPAGAPTGGAPTGGYQGGAPGPGAMSEAQHNALLALGKKLYGAQAPSELNRLAGKPWMDLTKREASDLIGELKDQVDGNAPNAPNATATTDHHYRPEIRTPRWGAEILPWATESGWALDPTTNQTVAQHLLNALHKEGFNEAAITDENFGEVIDLLQRHFAPS